MAVDLSNSQFVGVDFSRRQIADGLRTIERLGLTNIQLEQRDILEFDPQAGQFDFIIAHGVYSWVPENVRAKVLEICRDHLAANGIAFVSFNAHPGGHLRKMVREMMLLHIRKFSGEEQQLRAARELLDFLIESSLEKDTAYLAVLEWERGHVRQCLDHQLRHDLLEENYEPFFVSEVVDKIERLGLQYLGDANFPSMLPRSFPPEAFEKLKQYAGSLVEMEQYMDFVRNRVFRQMLICREGVALNHQLGPQSIMPFHVAAALKPIDEQFDPRSQGEGVFVDGNGAEVKTCEPIAKTAFVILREHWPGNLPFSELLDKSRNRIAAEGPRMPSTSRTVDAEALANSLMTCVANGIAHLSSRRYPCAIEVGETPSASRLSRFQAETGEVVTNLRHETVRIQDWHRPLLAELDGRKSREDLATRLSTDILRARFLKLDAAQTIDGPHFLRSSVNQRIGDGLKQLAECGLLIR